MRSAQCLGSSNVFLLLYLQNLSTDNAAHTNPVQHTKGHKHRNQVGTHFTYQVSTKATGAGVGLHGFSQHGRQKQDYKNLWHRINHFHDSLHHYVHLATKVAGNGAVERTNQKHQQGGGYTNNHGHTSSNHYTHHGVSSEFVSTKNVGEYGLSRRLSLQFSTGVAKKLVSDS